MKPGRDEAPQVEAIMKLNRHHTALPSNDSMFDLSCPAWPLRPLRSSS